MKRIGYMYVSKVKKKAKYRQTTVVSSSNNSNSNSDSKKKKNQKNHFIERGVCACERLKLKGDTQILYLVTNRHIYDVVKCFNAQTYLQFAKNYGFI